MSRFTALPRTPKMTAVANIRKAMVYDHIEKGGTVTLNGTPASVCGYMNDFATVATFGERRQAFEWSWGAVERVLNSENGGFRT